MKVYKYLIILIAVVIIAAISVTFLNKKSTLEVSVMKSYKGTITNAIEVSSENDVVILNPPSNLTEGINVKVMD